MYRYSGLIVFVGALAFCFPRMHAGEPRAPYRTLSAKWKADREALNDSSQSSDDKAEEQIADLKARYTKLFVELAKQHASDDETWVSCLMWVGQRGTPGDDFDAMIDLMRQHAGDLREPLQLRLFLSFLIRAQSVRLNPALRDLSENHPSKGIRGAALYVLAARMKIAAEEAGSIEECAEAESLLRRVVAEYPDATTYRGKNDDNAKALLDELHSPVAIGKTAPETVGNDLDGVEFNLGSMRGKVVVLSFSGHWCTPCRAMHPIQKKLLQKFASDEFAVVEINSDNKKNKKKVAEKMRLDGLQWHVVLDGSRGPISKQWHVSAWPTFCVLDRNHKIRRRGAGYLGEKLEDWVGELIREKEVK